MRPLALTARTRWSHDPSRGSRSAREFCTLLVLGALGACTQTGPISSAAEPAVTELRVEGTVVGPGGEPVDGAPVWLSFLGERSGTSDRPMTVAQGYTNSSGSFTLATTRVGSHRVESVAPGLRAGVVDLEVSLSQPPLLATLTLTRAAVERIRGILLSSDGMPLEDDDLALLFPAEFGHDDLQPTIGADGVPELYPFTGASELFARLHPRAGEVPTAAPLVRLDPVGAGFSLDAPKGSSGDVSVRFRTRSIATARWSPEARNIELQVDMAATRALLGSIDIEIGPGAGTERTLLGGFLREDDGLPNDEWGLTDAPPLLRLVGVPVGRYAFVVLGSTGAASSTARVAAGQTIHIALRPTPATTLNIAFDIGGAPPEGRMMERVELRTKEGLQIPLPPAWTLHGARLSARFAGVPAGDLVVHADGDALAVTAGAGSPAAEVRFPLAPERRYRLRVPLGQDVQDGQLIRGRLVRWNDRGLLCRDQNFEARVSDKSIEIPIESPPGRHRFRVDLGDGQGPTLEVNLATASGLATPP